MRSSAHGRNMSGARAHGWTFSADLHVTYGGSSGTARPDRLEEQSFPERYHQSAFSSRATQYLNSTMPATTDETLSLVTRTVSVAPLVLLSVADHYGRSAKGTRKRVVGVLLGQNDGKNVRVSNSFAGTLQSV